MRASTIRIWCIFWSKYATNARLSLHKNTQCNAMQCEWFFSLAIFMVERGMCTTQLASASRHFLAPLSIRRRASKVKIIIFRAVLLVTLKTNCNVLWFGQKIFFFAYLSAAENWKKKRMRKPYFTMESSENEKKMQEKVMLFRHLKPRNSRDNQVSKLSNNPMASRLSMSFAIGAAKRLWPSKLLSG